MLICSAQSDTGCCEPCCDSDPANGKIRIDLVTLMAQALQKVYLSHVIAASEAAGQQMQPNGGFPSEFAGAAYQEALDAQGCIIDAQAQRLLAAGISAREAAHLEHLTQVNEEAKRTVDEIRIFVAKVVAQREELMRELHGELQDAHRACEEAAARRAQEEKQKRAREAEEEEAKRRKQATDARLAQEAKEAAAARKLQDAAKDARLLEEKRRIEEQVNQKVRNWLSQNGFTDVNSKRTRFFKTSYPLHVAVEKNEVAMARMLLASKADVNLKNGANRTALDVAMKKDALGSHKEIFKVIAGASKKEAARGN